MLLPATNQVSFSYLADYALVKHLQNILYHSVFCVHSLP